MSYSDVVILIPSHSLEDLPDEMNEGDAASLLNAFAVSWHPFLLAASKAVPGWHRADVPPEPKEKSLILIPTVSDAHVPHGWIDEARGDGATIVSGVQDRDAMLTAILESGPKKFQTQSQLDPELTADFLALGTCYLQMELLTRHMHYFNDLDEVHLQREVVSAAEAAIAQDSSAAREHLRNCFESLTEARERFYPVECYLLNLCLLTPRRADDNLIQQLQESPPINFLVPACDLETLAAENPKLIHALRKAWEREELDFVGGEYQETAAPLMPLESLLWQFQRGHDVFEELLGRRPTTWGRRRFGLTTPLPQIISKFGYDAALHVLLDDGVYPDTEHSKLQWQGCDGTVIDAISRIPLDANRASSYLQFPVHMAESMEQDQTAAVIFLHWPDIKSPWFHDLRRMHRYSPALGQFVTFSKFFDSTDSPSRLSSFEAREYLSPSLIQTVARREESPVSRYADHFRRRQLFHCGSWCRALADLLKGKPVDESSDFKTASAVESVGPLRPPDGTDQTKQELSISLTSAAGKLADTILQGAGDQPGYLLINSLSFPRTTVVELPDLRTPPAIAGPVVGVQFDDQRRAAIVSLPGSGFAWIPAPPTAAKSSRSAHKVRLAEHNQLRNEYFEAYINEENGGLQRISSYGRDSNRLSQQLAMRFLSERRVKIGTEDAAEIVKTFYSEMHCHSCDVTCTGPELGEIVTTGELIDGQRGDRLARFRQTFRVWRKRPILELEIELELEELPEGPPWNSYYASRFAWNDRAASLTGSILDTAYAVGKERIESPLYFEIASGDKRTTVFSSGLPFHRKTGLRTLDTLLVTAGEKKRHFRFLIAIDQTYPMQTALDAMTPVAVVPTSSGPPRVGQTGWFFHLDSKNVQLTRILSLRNEVASEEQRENVTVHEINAIPAGSRGQAHFSATTANTEVTNARRKMSQTPACERLRDNNGATTTSCPGFAVRLVETEGRRKEVRLRCFRTPVRARQRDFQGHTISDLSIENDCVQIEMTAFEIADIELHFA